MNDDVLQDFLLAKQLQGIATTTISAYEFAVRRMFSTLDLPVESISASDLRKYFFDMKVGDVSKGIYLKNLRVFFRWCFREGYISNNPCENIPVPKVPNVFPYVLNEQELKRLVEVAKNNRRDFCILLVLIDTGVRATECCQIEVGDIDLKNRSLLIRKGKGSKSRYVFYSDLTARSINRWLAVRPDTYDNALFLSTRTKERLDRSGLLQLIKRLGVRAGIPKEKRCSPHTIRHSFASSYVRGGGSSHSLMLLLGHSSIQMSEKYVHLNSLDVQQIYKKFSPVQNIF
jgi:site-specific recombinase XerD